MRHCTIIALWVCCCLFLFPPATMAEENSAPLTVEIEPATPETPLTLLFTVKNNTSYAIKLLKWNTPLEGRFNSDSFRIHTDGTRAEYKGRFVKRRAPQSTDFVTVPANGHLSATVDLSQGYELLSTGQYEILFQSLLKYSIQNTSRKMTTESPILMEQSSSNSLNLNISTLPVSTPLSAKEGESEVEGECSSEQTLTLEGALYQAARISEEAAAALEFTSPELQTTALRYKTWFGNYLPENYSVAQNNFAKIAKSINNKPVQFSCGDSVCEESIIAFVYKNYPYRIYLCDAFWQLPQSGQDSQSGTIVHEISHFEIVADTVDHAYGHDLCRDLAIKAPLNALVNADNYEYFAENAPYRPMTSPKQIADMFAESPIYTAPQLFAFGNNQSATTEQGEPYHAKLSHANSVWISWIAPANGTITIDTLASTFDTVLAVYSGSRLSSLTELATNDDASLNTSQSMVTLEVVQGTTYHIAVSGFSGDTGDVGIFINTNFGDVDLNNSINIKDAVRTLQVISGQSGFPVSLSADINDDAKLGIEEALFIMQNIAEE